MDTKAPVHGTEQKRDLVQKFTPLPSGASIMEGRTVSERYCATCAGWVKCADLFAHMQCPQCHTRW